MSQPNSSESLWRRLSTYNIGKVKRSRKNLVRLCREHATDVPTLAVHPEFDYRPYFPNLHVIADRALEGLHADRYVDRYYRQLDQVSSASYDVILCLGLLEHIPEPQGLIDTFHRILRPQGKLILSVSAVFSFHGCPDDYFHYTPYGLRLLFRNWSALTIKGSSQPFETIGILLQRINLQAEILFPIRPVIEALAWAMPLLDRFIIRQYNTLASHRDEQCLSDSMLPSNLFAAAVK